jgi:hypothetical protein
VAERCGKGAEAYARLAAEARALERAAGEAVAASSSRRAQQRQRAAQGAQPQAQQQSQGWLGGFLRGSGGSSTVTSVVTSTVTPTITSTTTTYPAFGAYPDSGIQQTITSGSQQKVLFQNEEFDTNNNFANSRFTPTVAGYYQINAEVRFDGIIGPNNEALIAIYKNGSEHKRGYNSTGLSPNAGGSTWFAMQISSMVYANGSSDYFEIYAQHGNTSNLSITAINAPQITYWNGFYVPYQVITAVTGNVVVDNAVSSTVVTSAVDAGGRVTTVLNDISNFFNNKRKVFTLKSGQSAIVEGVNYRDNRDFNVIIGGRYYYAEVPQTTTLGPWMVDYVAGRTYEFKVTGPKLVFYREIANRQGAEIRINNVSSSRQKRSRYPFTANSIVLGE